MKAWMIGVGIVALAACDSTEVEREIGYKGKARINPWLAAERFAERRKHEVSSLAAWVKPSDRDAVWFLPASVLNNLSFTYSIEAWVKNGGHLILLMEHASSETNDWGGSSNKEPLHPALDAMLDRAGIAWIAGEELEKPEVISQVEFDGDTYDVEMKPVGRVSRKGGSAEALVSVEHENGRVTVLSDARVFRNRWISEHKHAELLDALIAISRDDGRVGFVRGSGLSLWTMIGEYLWPVLLGLGLWLVLWLWKNLSRFGPLEAVDGPSSLRGYEHHLEALGDFQWRLDRAAGLLIPLRAQVIDRGQRLRVRAELKDEDFFQFLADRAGLPCERVFRALAEVAPPDSFTLTRTVADLQKLLQTLI